MSLEMVAVTGALLFLTCVQLRADQWSPLEPLGGTAAIGSPGGSHPLAMDGETVHLVWAERGNIHYRRSTDGGLSWQSPVPLTSSGHAQYPCSLELSGSVLHLIWPDSRNGTWEIYGKRSADAGVTWGPDTRVTPGASLFRLGTAVSGSTVHVVWGSTALVVPTPAGTHTWGELYYTRSTDAGLTWKPVVGSPTSPGPSAPPIRLTAPDLSAMRPSIAASGDYVHLTWFDRRDSKKEWDWDIYYKRSTDGGATWGSDVRMTNTPTHSRHPQIVATPGGQVCCIWEDGSFFTGAKWEGDAALYAALSDDDGATWKAARRLTFVNAPNGRATHSKSYACGSRIHLAWTDSPEGPGGPQAAYYMSSPDGGVSWEAPEQLTRASDGTCLGEGVGGTESYAIVVIKKSDTLYYRRRDIAAPTGQAPTR